MEKVSTIGLDLAKLVFQVHGVDAVGRAVLRRQLRRGEVLRFFGSLEPCVVAMEACGSAHYWGREIGRLGHEVRLIAPAYVKPFVKRGKSDAIDAEAICEAVQRPTMRFVAVKSVERQAGALVFRTRDLLVRQRTQAINALRSHLAEFGMIAPRGPAHIAALAARLGEPGEKLPVEARVMLEVLADTIAALDGRIAQLDGEISRRAKEDDVAKRLMTIPGVGPITATAMAALAPPPDLFRRGRDFAAWLGLTPQQCSTGGRQQLGRVSKMGERTLRRLLIIGASAVVRHAVRRGAPPGSWLARMLATKPRMLIIVALANKMARMVWALIAKGGVYKTDHRAPVATA
jgi:transposase